MQTLAPGHFLFVVCQAGAEKALKAELAREHARLKFAYSRPGFVTFKSETGLPSDFELRSVFARAYGFSIGALKGEPFSDLDRVLPSLGGVLPSLGGVLPSLGGVLPSLGGVLKEAERLRAQASRPLRLHVFERNPYPPGEEPAGFEEGRLADEARLAVLRAAGTDAERLFADDPVAMAVGEPVLDLVVLERDSFWLGWHRHSHQHHAFPGGNPRLILPPDAPSRAYLKVEEALIWSRAPLRPGDQAVEIGSAPGGASLALLKRGLRVLGIDPGAMDPGVLGRPGYRHLSKSVVAVTREELPAKAEWLLLDMNAEPRVALAAAERIAQELKEGLLGVILTVKLNEWKLAERIPKYLESLREGIGLSRVRASQLAHNRQEICVYGLTRKGMAR